MRTIVSTTVSSGASVCAAPPSTGTTEYVALRINAFSGTVSRWKNGKAVLKWIRAERARRPRVEVLYRMMRNNGMCDWEWECGEVTSNRCNVKI